MSNCDEWLPTPSNILSLPDGPRKYIHDLETNADPAGTIAENTFLRDTNSALQKKITELEEFAADARRYRALRDRGDQVHVIFRDPDDFHFPSGEELDELCDRIERGEA